MSKFNLICNMSQNSKRSFSLQIKFSSQYGNEQGAVKVHLVKVLSIGKVALLGCHK